MGMKAATCLGAIGLVLASVPAPGGSASAAIAQTPAGEDILVTGSRDDPIGAFVEAVTVETDRQIARFEAPACPLSLGLPPDHNDFVEVRLRQIADHLGIGVQAPGCSPNIVVIVADAGDELAERLRADRPDVFATLDLHEIRAVMRQPGPVRSWQIVETKGADGRPLRPVTLVPGGREFLGVTGGGVGSLTRQATRQDLAVSYVVFDLDAIEGLTLLQLADHAAMQAFARTRVSAMAPGRSILTMFEDRQAAAGPARELTAWDGAYLRALYRTGSTVTAHQQQANMVRAMHRDLEAESTP
jgi:hypothetical protein